MEEALTNGPTLRIARLLLGLGTLVRTLDHALGPVFRFRLTQ